jgi:hypothetical protein
MNPQADFMRFLKAVTLCLLVALSLASCGKGMSSNGDMGTVDIAITDAQGDFISYAVDVTSLALTKADGTVVETLPQKTRIDFAQLVDLSEFVTGATIPAGNYVSATIQLDYSNADIEVDKDGSGTPIKAASIVDGQGNPVTTMSMTVKLDNARLLPIAPGIPALFDLDFNLAASNTVANLPNPPTVTVSPMLVADVNPDAPKPHRIRGPLDSVDTTNSSFTLVLRPFNLLQGDHGRLKFFTDSNTTFEIDQVGYVGGAGLAALNAKGRFTATVAIGTFDLPNRRFLATEVLAGSSVAFGTDDVLTGNVISRTGNTLVVKGAELVRNPGTLIFGDMVTVTVGSNTKVLKEGHGTICSAPSTTCATGDISVGQRVSVFGTLNAGGTALDATSGLVRMLVTQLNGVVSSASSTVVVMNLARIDGRPIALFNFAGTGTLGSDANPASYQVNPSGLPTAGIGNTTPLKVRGFVQPFGAATTTDDFDAITLVDVTGAPATLVVGWPLLQATPFNSYPAGGLVVNLTNAGFFHDVFREGVDTQLLTTDTPTVMATDLAHGLFVIGLNGTVQVYTQMSSYQSALQSNLAASRKARGFIAFGGTYTDSTKTLSAGVMGTALQ